MTKQMRNLLKWFSGVTWATYCNRVKTPQLPFRKVLQVTYESLSVTWRFQVMLGDFDSPKREVL